MKKLLILLFSILISFNSYGEWTEIIENVDGDTYYIDMDAIKEHGGYVYYWSMTDYLKPTVYGTMSAKSYCQLDCGVNRLKYLSFVAYEQPMGGGVGDKPYTPPDEWKYPPPESIDGLLLKHVCSYVE